jgi:hypothetical protein
MKIQISSPFLIIVIVFLFTVEGVPPLSSSVMEKSAKLPGFSTNLYFDEQVVTFNFYPDIRIHINVASVDRFDISKPVGLALYALPNGNTIEQTVGKILESGDDWHFDIQHIGAQTRFLRQQIDDYNLVTIYLETTQKSWPTWKSQHPNHAEIIKSLVEYLKSYFRDYSPFIILTGHSGGGRFTFSFMDAFNQLPDYVDRISFLDSNYGYEHSYGDKMIQWLNASPYHFLTVLAYNDSVALYNGQLIVSPTGGTWYRSKIMQKYFSSYFSFTSEEDDEFIRHKALNGRISIILKKNPLRQILHTVQVERNGFIHSMLSGTAQESQAYEYYSDRIYNKWIQAGENDNNGLKIPLRSPDAKTGSEFMQYVMNMSFAYRENAIFNEISTGNIPYFYRGLKHLQASFTDANGISHLVEYDVMPDYLAVGSDSDFCRIPMGPITAQRIADWFGATMPTRKLVDHIYLNAEIKLEPVTYTPVGNQNEKVEKFIEHNSAIEEQRIRAGGILGQLIGGTKKDVVLSNKITDPVRPNHVVIYGWHRLNGMAIQPLTNIHIDTYVDYSHGIRLLNANVIIDGKVKDIRTVLRDPVFYKILSDEIGLMAQPTYIADNSLPNKPWSFGVRLLKDGKLKILIKPDSSVDYYHVFTSEDGLVFNDPISFDSNEIILDNLPQDTIIYIKFRAGNSAGLSAESEVLAGFPTTATPPEILLVHGFDRSSTGNTYNFVRQHAHTIAENRMSFESATNDAITDGLFSLQSYNLVDYILGDESTVDETFSNLEQTFVKSYLQDGGRLFVSGSEIAWDLDYKGSTADKDFFHNYLKAQYTADAPGDVAGIHYSAVGIAGGLFEGITDITFDNGTHGTLNVKWADAISAINAGSNVIKYKNVTTYTIGSVSFEGIFPGGTATGKIVYLDFPFETIYPAATRNAMMKEIVTFMDMVPTKINERGETKPYQFCLRQNYPNPFNPLTTIELILSEMSDVHIVIYNILGLTIQEWTLPNQNEGLHQVVWNGLNNIGNRVSAGTYFFRVTAGEYDETRKMTVLK